MSKLKAEYNWDGTVGLYIGGYRVMCWEVEQPYGDKDEYADRKVAEKLKELFDKLGAL